MQGAEAKANQYIGQAKCKGCHASAETGDQHAQWAKSDYAKAFELLASDEAKKAGAEKGIADPQKDPSCLKCHVTAHGVAPELIKKGFDPKEATCRGCHNKESPTFKKFCFHEFRGKVSHMNPKKPRTDAEQAAILACGCGEACGCVEKCADGCGVPASSLKDKK